MEVAKFMAKLQNKELHTIFLFKFSVMWYLAEAGHLDTTEFMPNSLTRLTSLRTS